MNIKKILIISITLLLLLTVLTAITTQTPATQDKATPDNLVQGNVNPNGILWIVSYSTPQGSHYLTPFESIHANNLSLTVYSPLSHSSTNNITVLSFIPITQTRNGTTTTQITDPEYDNQSITATPRTVMSFDLHIPQTSGKREVSITWDNTTVSYFITTYKAAILPFNDNPLALVGIIGIVMLIFTGVSLGISKAIIERAKYFPPISQRIWGLLIMITLISTYELVETYYYDMTGTNWGLIFIPLFLFDLLEVLSVFPSKTELDELIQIRDTSANEIETGLYSIRTATMSESEKTRYNQIENQWGKEYIEERSYKDFVKRLFNIRIPIRMEVPEQPDKLENVKSLKPGKVQYQGKRLIKHPFSEFIIYSEKGKQKKRKYWTMKDRPSKEHPFTEAVLINPLKPPPALTYIEVPTGKKDKEGLPKTKKVMILNSFMDGRHMQEATDFISQYVGSSEAGFVIHRLMKQNALLKAEMEAKSYSFNEEIIGDMFQGIQSGKRQEQRKEDKTGDEEK